MNSVDVSEQRSFTDWLSHPAALLILAALIGLLLGLQFFRLNPRVVKLALALAVFFVMIRYPVYVGVGLFIIVYPFPSSIFIGNTNFIFAILMFLIWIVKFSLRLEPMPRSSLLGGAIFLFTLSNLVSFIMLPGSVEMSKAIYLQQYLVAALLLYAVMVNAVDTPRKLHFIFQAMTFSSLVVYGISLQEWLIPSLKLIPDWYIVTIGKAGHQYAESGRAQGIYEFHALLADSSAVNVILQIFLITRARKTWRRVYHGIVAVLAVVMISMSVNRGGFILLVVGLLLLAWHLRRDIRFSYLAVGLPVLGIVILAMEEVARMRFEDVSLLTRLASTRFQSLLPADRIWTWEAYLDLGMESPILGHGPYLDYVNIGGIWPHNAYIYYFYTLGIVGALIFLWMVLKSIWKTRPRETVSWLHGTYVRGAALFAHVAVIQFAIGQIRTDHQRGNEAIYYLFSLLGLAAISWSLLKKEKKAQMGQGQPVDKRPQTVVS
jgi:O-antigen ligase